MKSKLFLLLCVIAAIMTSCNTQKDIPYMIGANELPADVLQTAAKASDPVVMPGDMLQINVISRNAEAVERTTLLHSSIHATLPKDQESKFVSRTLEFIF